MKVYNLRCEHDHRFEGWFASEQECSDQLTSGRLACPLCESTVVTRLPSAPHVNTRNESAHHGTSQNVQQQVLQLMRDAVARSEDVGTRFADEARRMHYEEIPERPIRGTASREECAELLEECIGVLPIPEVLKEPLQ